MISAIVGLAGFVVAVVAGLAADNTASEVLARALVAMFVCNAVGSVVGSIANRTGAQHVEQYKKDTPIPSIISMSMDSEEIGSEEKSVAA